MKCLSPLHIFQIVLSSLMTILLVLVTLVSTYFYQEIQPKVTDSLSRIDTNFEIYIMFGKTLLVATSILIQSSFTSYFIVFVSIIASFILVNHYFKSIPYFSMQICVLNGFLYLTFLWTSLNSLCMLFIKAEGQLIVVFLGLPLIYKLTQVIYQHRVNILLKTTYKDHKHMSESVNIGF